jgi:hypothetical protein
VTKPDELMDILDESSPEREYVRGLPSASDAFTVRPEDWFSCTETSVELLFMVGAELAGGAE